MNETVTLANLPFAYKALQAEDKIGAMLPCNVIVQETSDGRVEITAIDPLASTAETQRRGELHLKNDKVVKSLSHTKNTKFTKKILNVFNSPFFVPPCLRAIN